MPASQDGQGKVWLAVGAVGVAAAAVLAGRVLDGGPALARLQQASVPLEAALSNGKPSVLEFYADWCEVCNELAPTTLQVRPHGPVCMQRQAPEAVADMHHM
jgi:thiol:disulfide interchange protein